MVMKNDASIDWLVVVVMILILALVVGTIFMIIREGNSCSILIDNRNVQITGGNCDLDKVKSELGGFR